MKTKLLVFVVLAGALVLPVFAKTIHIKKIGEYPNFVTLSPDGNFAYVTSYGTGELIEVDLKQKAISRATVVGIAPLGIALADGGKTALVACKESGTVAVVNLDSFRVEADIKVG